MNSCFVRLCPLLLILAVMSVSAKETPGSRIYSDVRLEEGEGELAGTELELKIDGTAATGVLKIYQGGCAEHVPVTGSAAGNTVHVSGEGQGFGKMEVTGTLRSGHIGQSDHFDGLLRMERNHTSEKIRLKKIAKPHC
jgi:hypothetical protein